VFQAIVSQIVCCKVNVAYLLRIVALQQLL
jgi:hypothetical protein